ncbi:hypothetical protein FOJ82_10315 [Tessaracoccus rhinocerotis]|uniref:Uncharacterized protein n=1 Tax=Tessaracoccus rhinocerotis TaxID=1689449 RepID=A0A553JZ09_9ACTN|nr:hypothetical protein [Tessaracoccus rhinocerotis]TRY17673.1 hypothetical protein FOJ82_10315 [Tessaracoccus rhinocerotis]
MSAATATARPGSGTWRAALVLLLAVVVLGIPLGSAQGLWRQQAPLSIGVTIGEWGDPCMAENADPESEGLPTPGQFRVAHPNHVEDGYLSLIYQLFWGTPTDEIEFCMNGVSLGIAELDGMQQAEFRVDGLPNGTYEFTYVLRNEAGEAGPEETLVVEVTQALPGVPELHHWNTSSTDIVFAQMDGNTNASSWRLLKDGQEFARGELEVRTPEGQQVSVDVGALPPGRHEFVMEFTNRFGTVVSEPLVVNVA